MARLGRSIPLSVTYLATVIELATTTHVASGRADGLASMSASGTVKVPSVLFGTGQSDGVATATADGRVTLRAAGQSDGVATMSASSRVTYVAAGQSDGVAAMTSSPTGVAGAIVPEVLFNKRILPGAIRGTRAARRR